MSMMPATESSVLPILFMHLIMHHKAILPSDAQAAAPSAAKVRPCALSCTSAASALAVKCMHFTTCRLLHKLQLPTSGRRPCAVLRSSVAAAVRAACPLQALDNLPLRDLHEHMGS